MSRSVAIGWVVALLTSAVSLQAQPASAPSDRAPHRPAQKHIPEQIVMGVAADLDGETVQWSPLDLAPLLQEDRQLAKISGIPLRVGINRSVPGGRFHIGKAKWKKAPDESAILTFKMVAPGAVAVRLHFSRLVLPPQGRLALADRQGDILQVITAQDLVGATEQWSAPVPGPLVRIVYSGTGADQPPVIDIDEISHIYRDPLTGQTPDDPGDQVAEPDLYTCHEDVNCPTAPPTPEVDAVARDAVARIIYTKPGGTFVCSGALLNDNDPNTYAGYFLTAHHCISEQAVVDSMTAYWFYQKGYNQGDSCNGSVPSLSSLPRSNGGTLLATSSNTDFTLLRLRDDPTDGQGFAAWSTANPTGTLAGIHHPGGTHKRKSFGNLTAAGPTCSSLPRTRYHYLDWYSGITEGGSSGSPLFNADWEVIGQLYGRCFYPNTSTGCGDQDNYNNVYGKLGVTWTAIASYLDNTILDDVYEENDDFLGAAAISMGEHSLRLVDFDDYFAINLTVGQLEVTARFDPADMNLDLELLDDNHQVIAGSSSSASGRKTILATGLSAGPYIVHVSRQDKWGGDYTLTLSAPSPDYDGDGDVDQTDFGLFQTCLSGVTPATMPDCAPIDLNGDGYINSPDYAMFSACFSGPEMPWDPACLNP